MPSRPFVKTVPTDYNAEFIATTTGAESWVKVDTTPDNDPDNSTYVFVFDLVPDNQANVDAVNLKLDDLIADYDAQYASWALPEYIAQVDAKLFSEFQLGFTVPDGIGAGPLAGHTLQTRGIEDRTNWLTSQAAYSAQVAGGNGALPGATFRDTGNTTVTATFAEGHMALLGMAAWGSNIFKRSWALKDALLAATTWSELDTIIADLDNGWPSSPTA
jgi:hypothetical protein